MMRTFFCHFTGGRVRLVFDHRTKFGHNWIATNITFDCFQVIKHFEVILGNVSIDDCGCIGIFINAFVVDKGVIVCVQVFGTVLFAWLRSGLKAVEVVEVNCHPCRCAVGNP